jgi:hypothetical protein
MVRFILRDYRCLCRCSDITAWRGGRGVAEDGKTLVQNRLQYKTENFGRKKSSLSEVETEPGLVAQILRTTAAVAWICAVTNWRAEYSLVNMQLIIIEPRGTSPSITMKCCGPCCLVACRVHANV